jgi:uncharacterized phage protein (TIGR02220 family)
VNAPESSSPIEFNINKFNINESNGTAPPSPPAPDLQVFIKSVINDWNEVTGQSRNPKAKDIQRLLKARYKEGFTDLQMYKLVHRYIYSSWHGNKWTNKESGKPSDFYIRPKTVYSEGKINGFGDGFAEYLEQAKNWIKKSKIPVCPKCGKPLANEIKNRVTHCYNCDADIKTIYQESDDEIPPFNNTPP